jgi:hypothetical protein
MMTVELSRTRDFGLLKQVWDVDKDFANVVEQVSVRNWYEYRDPRVGLGWAITDQQLAGKHIRS